VIDPAVPAVLPSDLEADLEAALREATSNAARHGRATRVDVDLLAAGDVLVLRVRDDGGGIGPISREGGLRNLRERAERRDGDLEVRALESGGTELAWRVSLRSAD
jgi:signal transduction histidine kinase